MEVKDLPRVEAGNLLLACTLALTAGPALAGLVLRRFGRAPLLLAGSHLLAAGVILLLLGGGPDGWVSRALGLPVLPATWDLVLLVLFGLLISFQVMTFPLVRAAVPAEQAGRALSAGNLSYFLGAAVLQGLSGLAAGWGGVEAALGTFAVALLVCTIGFLVLQPRR